MDDLTLLQLFVSGNATLEANKSFKVQPTDKVRQLFTSDGSLLASAYDTKLPPTVCLRMGTKYTSILHQTLIDNHYVPISNLMTNRTVFYEYHPVPSDFVIRCDSALNLWKSWWQDRKQYSRRQEKSLLQILTSGKWRFIEKIVLNRSTLYITADNHESVFQGDDKIIWLEQNTSEATVLLSPHPDATASSSLSSKPMEKPDSHGSSISGASSGGASSGNNVRVYNLDNPALRFRGNKLYISTPTGEIVLVGEQLKQLALLVKEGESNCHQNHTA